MIEILKFAEKRGLCCDEAVDVGGRVFIGEGRPLHLTIGEGETGLRKTLELVPNRCFCNQRTKIWMEGSELVH